MSEEHSVEVFQRSGLGWKSIGQESFVDLESAHGFADLALAMMASDYNVLGCAVIRDSSDEVVQEIRTRRLSGVN